MYTSHLWVFAVCYLQFICHPDISLVFLNKLSTLYWLFVYYQLDALYIFDCLYMCWLVAPHLWCCILTAWCIVYISVWMLTLRTQLLVYMHFHGISVLYQLAINYAHYQPYLYEFIVVYSTSNKLLPHFLFLVNLHTIHNRKHKDKLIGDTENSKLRMLIICFLYNRTFMQIFSSSRETFKCE